MTTDLTNEELRVAWEVEIDGMACIVFATTAAKAKWAAVRGYWDAGYGRKGIWPPSKVKRRPGYDRCSLADKPPRAWSEEYVLSMTALTP